MIAAPGGASTTTPPDVNNAVSVFATHPPAEHASDSTAPSNQGVPTTAAAGAPETGRAPPAAPTDTQIIWTPRRAAAPSRAPPPRASGALRKDCELTTPARA